MLLFLGLRRQVERDIARDQRLEDLQLVGVEEPIQIAAQVDGALQRDRCVHVFALGEMRGAQALQRTQQLAIRGAGGSFEDVDAVLVILLGRRIVLEPVMNRAQVRERIDQRPGVFAVLLFGERDHFLRERQRFGVFLRVEGRAELLVRIDALGIGHGPGRARCPGGQAACDTGCNRAYLT